MTKVYCYNEPIWDGHTVVGNDVVELTEREVLESPWAKYWMTQMLEKYGEGHPLISKETCLEDFVAVNWAWIREEP